MPSAAPSHAALQSKADSTPTATRSIATPWPPSPRNFEGIIATVSWAARALFAAEDPQAKLEELLARLGEATDASRICICKNATDPGGRLTAVQWREWPANGMPAGADDLSVRPLPYFQRWRANLERDDVIGGRLADFPLAEQELLRRRGVLSILLVPIFAGDAWWGLIAFDDCREARTWQASEIDAMKAVAAIVGGALGRHRLDENSSAQAARFRDFAEIASDWFWEQDADLRFTMIVPNRASAWSEQSAQFLGKTFRQTAPEGVSEAEWRRHDDAVARRLPIDDFRYERIDDTGRKRHLVTSARPFFDANGRFLGYRGAGKDITEQIEAGGRAWAADHPLRAAIESLDDGFALFDADDRLVLCNEQMHRSAPELADAWVPGTLFADILTLSAYRGYAAEAAGREDEWVRERLSAHRTPAASSIIRQIKSGRWIQTKEIPTANGGLALIRYDITELKRRELDLEQSRAHAERMHRRLIDAIESLPDGFVYCDEDDRLVACNTAFLNTYPQIADRIRPGLTFVEFLNLAWDAGMVPTATIDKETWLAERMEAHRNPGPPIERCFNNRQWIRVIERRTSDGGYVSVGLDVTELRFREIALKETEERFSGYFNHSPEALFVVRVEPDGRLIYEAQNPVHGERTGLASDELLGKTPEECLDAARAEQVTQHFHACVAARTPIRYVEELDTAGGRVSWDTTLVPMRDPAGDIVRILGSSRNVTEQRRVEAELVFAKDQAEASNRAKSNFLANMSHELRTPLNAVIGFSEILATELLGRLGSPKYVEYAQDIQRSGRHLLELINDILDMSRIEAGRYELSRESVDPHQLIAEVTRLVSVNAAQAGVWLADGVQSDLPTVQIDRRAVRQVLLNLLSNAIKFTPKSGTVTITAEATPETLSITVADSGIGIAKSDLSRLAKPFEQVDNVMTRRQEGSGLGLAISKALVELHGGRLIIESELGLGTRVTVTLPRIAAE
jgi:two-component system cell cycle sensor histidine kinase PleC